MPRVWSPELVDPVPAKLGEGPIWDTFHGNLLWVDIRAGAVHRTSESGVRLSTTKFGIEVGAVLPGHEGETLVATSDGLSIVGSDNSIRPLSQCLLEHPDVRFNDGKADPRGRAVLGTLSYSRQRNASNLFRLDHGPNLVSIVSNVTTSNGLGWSSDGQIFYYIDTATGNIDKFDYDIESGGVRNRRVFATVPEHVGKPDGLCVDHEGGVWVAIWGSGTVVRYLPNGSHDRTIELPVPFVSSCAFGGRNGDILFITTAANSNEPDHPQAGCLFAVEPNVTGPPATLWAPLSEERSD